MLNSTAIHGLDWYYCSR